VLTLNASWENPKLLWSWVILLGVFMVDATFTLCRRLLQRQKVYQAHRSHAYQHAAQQFRSHKRVTVTVVAINVAWLMPISMLVANGEVSGLLGVLIAYVPLIALAFYFKAGAVSV
jgi:Fuc2NAc and GlcNAc transferase